ncbi:OTU domain [Trinorchestia longiramus]|nr:OTU domain [Trinorchestia longiramus]
MDDITKSLNVTLSHTLADGHCFLHAVALQLNETQNTMQACEFLMRAIEAESRTNKNRYKNFIDEDSGKFDLLVHKYLHDKILIKQPGTSSLKLLLMLYKNHHIYSERNGGIWKTIVQPTITRQINKSPLLVHLKNYHYSALINEKNATNSKSSSSR